MRDVVNNFEISSDGRIFPDLAMVSSGIVVVSILCATIIDNKHNRLLNALLLNALQGLPGCALVNLMCSNCVVWLM